MAERDRVLEDFQACTGIENFEECIATLEQHNWNLMEAVSSAMPHTQTDDAFLYDRPPDAAAHSTLDAVFGRHILPPYADSGGGAGAAVAPSGEIEASASGRDVAPAPARLINFHVEFRERNVHLAVKDCETVGKLKELLQEEVDVPVGKQQLFGWLNKQDRSITDQDVLSDLHLPKENTLFLLVPDLPTQSTCNSTASTNELPDLMERLSQTFMLNILYKDRDKLYQLHFIGSRTVLEVKSDVYSVTDVPVRHQQWQGWPDAASDESMTLAGIGIDHPCHNLELTCAVAPVAAGTSGTSERGETTEKQNVRRVSKEEMDDDGSDDDFEDAHDTFGVEDDMFEAETAGARRQEPLMPENCSDQTIALQSFVSEFSNRYGTCHPVFYVGRLDSAIADALQCRARDRKLLAVYLHHDDSILTNVFCSQILCSETVVSYLTSNFVTWAWDLTSESNKARLLTLCTKHFGSITANTIRNYRNFRPNELPLVLLLSRSRSSNEVVNVIHGNTTLDELMTHLIHAVEVFNEQLKVEIAEEDERDARELMKREQDSAYQQSLAADQAKAEARRKEEEEQRRREAVDERQRRCEEEARLEEEAAKEAIRLSVLDLLPDEPASDSSQPISCLRFRCPAGETITRRFLASSTLQVALNFLVVKGYDLSRVKLLTTFPRRDLMQVNSEQSLMQLKLFPQETLTVEEK